MQNLVALCFTVRVYVGGLRILGCCGSTPLRYGSWEAVETRPSLGWGRGWLIETRPSGPTPACVAVPKVAPGQTVTKFTMRMRNTTWPIGGCYKLTTNFFFFFFFFSRRFPCRYRLGLPITRSFPLLHDIQCLKWSKKRSRISAAIRGRFPLRRFFWSENSEFWCIVSGILCDLVLQESKQETRYRPGKGTRAPTRATRPHFKPWRYHGTFRSIETSAIVKQ